MIGCLYQFGAGVPQDGSEAVRWYRKAAAQDHPIAWCNVIWVSFMCLASWARLMMRRAENVICVHINWEVLLN